MIKGNVSVYPLYTEAAINATPRTRPITRLYVTRVKSNTRSPGRINPAKYRIMTDTSSKESLY
jgi:hypothetical protein